MPRNLWQIKHFGKTHREPCKLVEAQFELRGWSWTRTAAGNTVEYDFAGYKYDYEPWLFCQIIINIFKAWNLLSSARTCTFARTLNGAKLRFSRLAPLTL
jgi:hypothetical protein